VTKKLNVAKAAVAAAAILISGTAVAQEIKLGFNGDLSASPSAQSGQAAVLGIRAAIEDVNAAGGVLGRNLTLVVRDDLSQPPKSIQNMSDLIDNEKVVTIFGPTNSGNAMAWKHIPNQKKIPVLNPISSATDITKPVSAGADNYMFRVSMVDREQISGLLAYTKASAAAKKIAFMAETTGYGQAGLKDLQEVSQLYDVKPVTTEKFGVNDTDMTSQLNKLKGAGVDTILVWAQGTPLGQLERSKQKVDYFPQTITSWAADNNSFLDAAGKELAGKPLFLRTISPELTPKQQQLFDRLSSKISSASPFGFAAHAYDATMLVVHAIKQAGATDGPKVREALENLETPYDGYMKTYNKPFSKTNHEALTAADYKWVKWEDGKLAPYSDETTKSLKPSDFKK
jgi:branched-chain amino acid transport system substrate-binding protein